jgi:hypothetical protein
MRIGIPVSLACAAALVAGCRVTSVKGDRVNYHFQVDKK